MKAHYKTIERRNNAMLMIAFAVSIALTFVFGKLV